MIHVAGDHLTVDLVEKIEKHLNEKSINFTNVGSRNPDEPILLQEIIPAVTKEVIKGNSEIGILVCGTGAGVEIGANRFKGIRASLCTSAKQAEFARVYDNANVLCLGSWLTEDPTDILDAWFNHSFDNNEERAQMIRDFDDWS